MITISSAQAETAEAFRRAYEPSALRWVVPPLRLEEEGDKAFRTVGGLELHLFLGARGTHGEWFAFRVQKNGHALDRLSSVPVQPPWSGDRVSA